MHRVHAAGECNEDVVSYIIADNENEDEEDDF